MRVTASDLRVTIDGHVILDDAALTAETGAVIGLVGPNGSGKSTLLRSIYRAIRPDRGAVLIGQTDVWRLPARKAGRLRAVVTQDQELHNDFSVRDVVALGRVPHQGLLDRETADDREVVAGALERVGMTWARSRLFATLSGGERQRVLLARALAQQTPVLLLDEPTNHLDIGAQLELLDLVRDLGLTTICALHDLDHALAYCDELVLLRGGRVVAAGGPVDVLTPQRLTDVFGVRGAFTTHPLTGRPHLVVAALNPADPPNRRVDADAGSTAASTA
ncbi:ABC transporter ATP-binding protein [Micromonospora sp. WMMD975]|uniref:ABC transporter ATP-binding protein n=1 Tax=Micromonospora sp. WMMD975 TaxID=3016087 RepID=UPI00249B96B2|nr:ABC transporter ATP-binding protein [Micromonospora sp. WMMD975]WFE30940.1 ABC transporter ATP-binding protein [Micromonospora sp. WMMD975]